MFDRIEKNVKSSDIVLEFAHLLMDFFFCTKWILSALTLMYICEEEIKIRFMFYTVTRF